MKKCLIVKPSKIEDKEIIETIFEKHDYLAEWDEEYNEFELEEQNLDELEIELTDLFNRMGISISFSSGNKM